jgi:hypothetical protein
VFTDSVNQLMDSSLIMVDRNIARLLKSVASIPQLCKVLFDTAKTTSYVTEFSRARVTLTRNGTSETKLKLPADSNRLFAFVMCLLVEIDSGSRVFLDFLKEFYYDKDSEVSFQMFISEVVKPFKKAGEGILKSVDPDSLDEDNFHRAEKFFSAERIYINTDDLRYALSLANDCREKVAVAVNCTRHQQSEALYCADALVNALHFKNPRLLTLSWLAFKYTVDNFADTRNNLISLEQIILRYVHQS